MIAQDSEVLRVYREEAAGYVSGIQRSLIRLRHGDRDERIIQRGAQLADGLLGASVTVGQADVAELAREIRDELNTIATRGANGDGPHRLLESVETIARLLDATLGTEEGGFHSTLAARSGAEEVYRALFRWERESTPAAREEFERRLATFCRDGAASDRPPFRALGELIEELAGRLEKSSAAPGDVIGHLHQALGLALLLEAGHVEAIAPAVGGLRTIVSERTGPPARESASPAPERAEVDLSPRRRVVVATHSDLFLEPLLEALTEVEVMRVDGVEELRRRLGDPTVDLCLLRDSLPGGLDACEERTGSGPGVPVVVYSPLSRFVLEVSERGLAGFLRVPCPAADVRRVVDGFLKGGR